MAPLVLTNNGAAALATTNSALLDLQSMLVRGADAARVDGLFAEALKEATTPEALVDLVVLAFQTRALRGGGKGEKELSYRLIRSIWTRVGVDVVLAVLPLLPTYGYYKDLLAICALEPPDAIAGRCLSLMAEALAADDKELTVAAEAGRTPKLSLAGKWAPRENSACDRKLGLAAKLAALMFGTANKHAAQRKYRLLVSRLNAALQTPEAMMAAGKWAEISFARVSSLALHRYRKAFLNEKLKGICRQLETGDRHPHDASRVAARQHLRQVLASKRGVKGAALMPHEIVAKVVLARDQAMVMAALGDDLDFDRRGMMSMAEGELMDGQWASMRDGVAAQLQKAAGKPRGVDLGKLVALVDVSGSMTGTPMDAAIGLGVLVSELACESFKGRVLTFESQPQWVDLSGCTTILQKVEKLQAAPWGGSTNFGAACDRILAAAEHAKLKPDEIPDLLVLSDMQFDEAGEGEPWTTHYERLVTRFAEVGTAVSGEPWAPPRLIFWNLAAAGVGFPVASDAPNTQLLSGFAPSMLKLVLSGDELALPEEDQVVVHADGSTSVERRGAPTPMETLRAALDDAAFDPVRLKLSELKSGPLAEYRFAKAEAGFELVDLE